MRGTPLFLDYHKQMVKRSAPQDSGMFTSITLRQLNRATLARQMLLTRASVPVVEAVERLGGIQAQEPGPPFVGLWSRIADFCGEELHAALQRHELVRGTMMRGTLHLVSAEDYAAFRTALDPVLRQGLRTLGERGPRLDEGAVLAAAHGHLAKRPRTFTELRGLLVAEFSRCR